MSQLSPSCIRATCHTGIATAPLRRLALGVLFTIATTSYQTTCTVSERSSIEGNTPMQTYRVEFSHYDNEYSAVTSRFVYIISVRLCCPEGVVALCSAIFSIVYFSEGVVAPAYYLLVCIFQKPLHSIFYFFFSEEVVSPAFYLFVCIFRRGCRPCITQCYLFLLYFSEGVVSPAFYLFVCIFRRGCRPCITQCYLFLLYFSEGVVSPAFYLFVCIFRRGSRPCIMQCYLAAFLWSDYY